MEHEKQNKEKGRSSLHIEAMAEINAITLGSDAKKGMEALKALRMRLIAEKEMKDANTNPPVATQP